MKKTPKILDDLDSDAREKVKNLLLTIYSHKTARIHITYMNWTLNQHTFLNWPWTGNVSGIGKSKPKASWENVFLPSPQRFPTEFWETRNNNTNTRKQGTICENQQKENRMIWANFQLLDLSYIKHKMYKIIKEIKEDILESR